MIFSKWGISQSWLDVGNCFVFFLLVQSGSDQKDETQVGEEEKCLRVLFKQVLAEVGWSFFPKRLWSIFVWSGVGKWIFGNEFFWMFVPAVSASFGVLVMRYPWVLMILLVWSKVCQLFLLLGFGQRMRRFEAFVVSLGWQFRRVDIPFNRQCFLCGMIYFSCLWRQEYSLWYRWCGGKDFREEVWPLQRLQIRMLFGPFVGHTQAVGGGSGKMSSLFEMRTMRTHPFHHHHHLPVSEVGGVWNGEKRSLSWQIKKVKSSFGVPELPRNDVNSLTHPYALRKDASIILGTSIGTLKPDI